MINSEITTSACDKLYGVPGNNIYTTHQTGGGTSPITWSRK